MTMGLSRNTPDYIWTLELGRVKIARQARKRASQYMLTITRMRESCLREEVRGLLTARPSEWGERMKKAFRKAVDDDGPIVMPTSELEHEAIENRLKRGL